jgi:UDP-N-acetylmuramyl-tripeptide synthetase/UDP-N-acetylmuramoyl-tripeptide--D-alanyl-D-alanine ligase
MNHRTISVRQYIELLKEHGIWIAEKGIGRDLLLSGKPVTDSRQVSTEDIFICIKGFSSDGHDYVQQAIAAGAGLVVYERFLPEITTGIQVNNSRKAAALLAKLYFNNPTGKLTLIGITGTNGKTTTSMLIWQALTFLGHKAGWIGTLGYTVNGILTATQNTTPDIMELNSILADMESAGCQYVVMEVSSHALALDRVYGLEFDLALFSNLTREHLDFHNSMEDYYQAKCKLFDQLRFSKGTAIINTDDIYGKRIYSSIKDNQEIRVVSVSEKQGDYRISDVNCSAVGSSFNLSSKKSCSVCFQTNLIGHFNVLNCAMSAITIEMLLPNVKPEDLQEAVKQYKTVRGRLEQVSNSRGIGVYIDYAHTPDALKNVLETLCNLPHKRIITVFGAGGDRDRGKRHEMLNTCLKYSDAVIITDDNPRTEDPEQIIREIVGISSLQSPWWIIRDRYSAIRAALRLSLQGDMVLIAGKGHETYQEYHGVRYHFDDAETARELLAGNYMPEQNELVLPIESLLLELIFKSRFININSERAVYNHISTDSRSIRSNTLFFALKGERFDGMDYVDDVLNDKTCGAVTTETVKLSDKTITVADTTICLGTLAQKYLAMFSPDKIALTGSTGKTTTKEYLANIFEQAGPVLKTYENENNIIGLSKTIFRIRPKHKTAIFELGTNHFGEIRQLADICNPDIGIITNIGPAHLEFFGDEAGVYQEKTDLFRRKLKLIIYPGDDSRFGEFQGKGISVGFSNACNYKIEEVQNKTDRLDFKLNGMKWSIEQPVFFYVTNVSYAIAAALESGISESQIKAGLAKPITHNMRMEIRKMHNRQFIIDCYNANPVSMKSAIQFWQSYNKEVPHVAILGDMLELGERSVEYHQSIGQMLEEINFDMLITVGEMSQYYNPVKCETYDQDNQHCLHFENVEELLKQPVAELLPANSVILIKASHSMNLEKLLDAV